MEEILVACVSPVLKALFEKLTGSVLRCLGFPFNVEEKLKSLEEETLPKIHCVLDRAEMQHFLVPVPEIWLRKLKGVAYDIEDVLGDYKIQHRFADIAWSRYDIGKKIDEIQHRFEDIANERKDLIDATNLPPPQTHLQISEWRATTCLPTESSVFGRVDDKEHLVRRLLGHEESAPPTRRDRLTVIPIVGMGGLGKTTLAQEVYNDPRVEVYFSKRIWVCVSNELNVTLITEKIFEGASGNKPESGTSLNTLQTKLQLELSSKRFLLVLDDVWSEDRQAWKRLRAPLNFGEEGSMVVITTRSNKVADIMGAADPLLLKALEESDFWGLFQSCAFVQGSSEKHRRLEEIGKQIAGRLKGVPLAAKTMGGLLSDKLDEEWWKYILDSEMWKSMQGENDIMPVLRLSYQQMPGHLKPCFAFCSLFPKDSDLYKGELVRFWMAQGFVEAEGRRRMEDIGSEYFDDLVCRSFFQKVDGRSYYLMHDLVHDLAQSISGDECVYITRDGNTKEIPPEKVLHLSLQNPDSSFEFKDLYKLKRLRTLIYRGPPKRVPKKLFKRLRYLRVLDLSYYSIEELPDSIGLLKQLRYLDLSFTHIRGLPEAVGDLCNLQTLRLERCPSLSALPKSMNKLTKLRHFQGNTALLSKVAGIGNLKSLQTLRLEFCQRIKELPDSLSLLKHLRYLDLSFTHMANERRDLIDAANLPPPQTHQISYRDATSSLPTEPSVFGRGGDKEHLVRPLLGHEETASPTRRLVDRLTVIAIVGMGGLGKTTLAREIYNNPQVVGHFHKRIWVYVSNDFNVTQITKEILEGASGNKPESGASLNTLQTKLQSELSNKRFLLVLDDVWSEDRQAWETLRAPLYFGEEGSRVVITTRSSRVADFMGAADPLLLKPLEKSDFWDLFQSCAFVHGSSEKHRRLEEIGKQIAGRLKGVPLAAKTMGGLLSSNLDEGAWNDVLNSEIWKLPQRENDIMPVLRLSYQQMPAHLKPCFAFCSLFPKDSYLYKEILVRFWMAQGFVKAEGRRRMEDIGGEYFDDLVQVLLSES